jgi:hypothetical protein
LKEVQWLKKKKCYVMPWDMKTWQLEDVLFLHQNDKKMEEARERI